MVDDQTADAHDAIFEASSQSIRDWAVELTENYQEFAQPGVVAAWPIGHALVVNGVLAMAAAASDMSTEAVTQLCDEVLAFIGARLAEANDGQVAA